LQGNLLAKKKRKDGQINFLGRRGGTDAEKGVKVFPNRTLHGKAQPSGSEKKKKKRAATKKTKPPTQQRRGGRKKPPWATKKKKGGPPRTTQKKKEVS